MSEPRPRILLADDHPMVLAGLRVLLERELEVVATVSDGHALLAAAERLRPDLVITGIGMPGLDGIEATRRLQAEGLGNKEIARRLGVEVTTIRTHLSRLYEKLRLENRVELALYAAHAGGETP